MGHTLTLEVPEKIYEPLIRTAKQTGRTPEKLALEWLKTAIRTTVEDPVENFIGVFKSNIPDWADQHNKYIGADLMKQIEYKGDKDN
ncbi:MAG: hypothetical protein AB1422_13080 [bacterium]